MEHGARSKERHVAKSTGEIVKEEEQACAQEFPSLEGVGVGK
jgi:hypothetical protein